MRATGVDDFVVVKHSSGYEIFHPSSGDVVNPLCQDRYAVTFQF